MTQPWTWGKGQGVGVLMPWTCREESRSVDATDQGGTMVGDTMDPRRGRDPGMGGQCNGCWHHGPRDEWIDTTAATATILSRES